MEFLQFLEVVLMDESEVGWATVVLSGDGGSLKEGLRMLGFALFLDYRLEVSLLWGQARFFVFHQKISIKNYYILNRHRQ